jgi:predicted nucleotide-binding protein
MAARKKKSSTTEPKPQQKRKYLSQSDVPSLSLTEALRIAQILNDDCGKQPTKPLLVAKALDMTPTSSTFRMLCGASIAYGFTDGGYNATAISLTELGKRVVSPTEEGDDLKAMQEAALKPRVMREFLSKYSDARLPSKKIGENVLAELGVPQDRTDAVFDFIVSTAQDAKLLTEVKGHKYVSLDGVDTSAEETGGQDTQNGGDLELPEMHGEESGAQNFTEVKHLTPLSQVPNNKVFITHGKDREIANQLKTLLEFGKFEPVISVKRESVSKPVPDKVMDDMRSCSAAVIHVDAEKDVLDQEGNSHRILNPNVLIEIGAAMALYRRSFILLVKEGVDLPSNLQGLYEVRYNGDKLDYEATMKLLNAFNDFRKTPAEMQSVS